MPDSPITVVVWGDSIAAGAWPQRAESAYNVVLNTGTPIRIVNEAQGGMPAAAARGQFASRVLAHHPQIVVIHFGANDLRHEGTRGPLPISTPDEFADHLAAMIRACKEEAGARVLVLGYHRVRKPLTLPTGFTYPDALRSYGEIALKAAAAAGADFLSMEEALAAVPDTPWTDIVAPDGVHLSELGVELYAAVIASRLAEMAREVLDAHSSATRNA